MATDSATLDRRATGARLRPTCPNIHSPAAPIARGIGLDRPFFDDKNRAFWILQSIGWSGYFFLRSLSGFANSMGWMFLVHTLLLTATGYSLTLLMASLFRRLITMRPALDAGPFAGRGDVRGDCLLGHRDVEFRDLPQARLQARRGWSISARSCSISRCSRRGPRSITGSITSCCSRTQIRQRERLEGQASTAQLAMLRYQLNPHFLFNTLNSISTLVLLKQTERANAMLARLSSFLRYTLVNEPTAKVTLAQEVETLKLYLEIEKMRFEDRLRPHFKIESETIGARLPSLLLQPLIENAIKYAVTPAENGADIWISAQREGQAVRIEVADNGDGEGAALAASPSTGVGLANIRDRLAQAYGAAHRFETKTERTGGLQRYHRNSL